MSDLSKLDIKIEISDRLTTVRKDLKTLDKLTDDRAKAQAELEQLKADESALLKDENQGEDKKLAQLLKIRAGADIKTGALGVLDKKIKVAEETVAKAGEHVSRFLSAFHQAVLVCLKQHIASVTSAFILPEDVHSLMGIAARHPVIRQVHAWTVPFLMADWKRGYEDAIREARVLDLTWKHLADVADGIPGELSVSIPETWL